MIDATILFKEVDKNGKAHIDTKIEVEGHKSSVIFEMAALLEDLWDIDDGETLLDAMEIHQQKMLSEKA